MKYSAFSALVLPALTAAVVSSVGKSGGGSCTLKPGASSAYKALCESEKTAVACATVNVTCAWVPTPTPAPVPTPAPTPCGSPAGRPCAPVFNPLDLTGMWMMADTGPASRGMLWAQQLKPPSCFAGACSGASYTFTCLTRNYSAGSPFTTGNGCPWATATCIVNADEEPYPGNYVQCMFNPTTEVISQLLDGGTLLGANPDFPGSGVGWRRLTGKMTGLWSPVNDNRTETEAVYAVGHGWADNSLRVWQFPADAPATDWQWGGGSLAGDGRTTGGKVTLTFNADAVGTMVGNVNVAGDKITGVGGLSGWAKRSCIWTATDLADCSISIAGCAAGCGYLHTKCGPNVCNDRLPANRVGSYRNILYTSEDCSGSAPAAVIDVRLSSGCADYGTAGAVVGFNASSGNVSLRVFDGSDCPCGTYTPYNPQGGGGDCTCPASRCAVKASHVLEYNVHFGDDAATARCYSVAPENTKACDGDKGSTPCSSQKWMLTPAPEDNAACLVVLNNSGCSDARKQGPTQCSQCVAAPATWNKLKYLACLAATVDAWCGGGGELS